MVSVNQYFLYQELAKHKDEQLAAIAAKSLKELSYHLRWSSDWVLRLGDGTEESKKRMQNAIAILWPYTKEWTEPIDYELNILGDSIITIQNNCKEKVTAVLEEAGLTIPQDIWMHRGGKQGKHTEHLGYILTEMQFLQRAYPNSEW